MLPSRAGGEGNACNQRQPDLRPASPGERLRGGGGTVERGHVLQVGAGSVASQGCSLWAAPARRQPGSLAPQAALLHARGANPGGCKVQTPQGPCPAGLAAPRHAAPGSFAADVPPASGEPSWPGAACPGHRDMAGHGAEGLALPRSRLPSPGPYCLHQPAALQHSLDSHPPAASFLGHQDRAERTGDQRDGGPTSGSPGPKPSQSFWEGCSAMHSGPLVSPLHAKHSSGSSRLPPPSLCCTQRPLNKAQAHLLCKVSP